MTQNKYPNSGRLSNNRYKDNPRKPDVVGEISMTRTALKELMAEHDGDDIVIKLSGWHMEGQYGPWTRLSWNDYKPKEQTNGNVSKPAAAAPAQQNLPDDSDDVPF